MSLTDVKHLTPNQRAHLVEKGIYIAWESLETHLECTHKSSEGMTKEEIHEEQEHHKRSVREYAELIKILSQLY